MVSLSVYSLPTITDSAQNERIVLSAQEPRSSCQADEVLSQVSVVCDKTSSDSLKTLKETKAALVKKTNNPFCMLRRGPSKPCSKM